jgi:hypothetical protein
MHFNTLKFFIDGQEYLIVFTEAKPLVKTILAHKAHAFILPCAGLFCQCEFTPHALVNHSEFG